LQIYTIHKLEHGELLGFTGVLFSLLPVILSCCWRYESVIHDLYTLDFVSTNLMYKGRVLLNKSHVTLVSISSYDCIWFGHEWFYPYFKKKKNPKIWATSRKWCMKCVGIHLHCSKPNSIWSNWFLLSLSSFNLSSNLL